MKVNFFGFKPSPPKIFLCPSLTICFNYDITIILQTVQRLSRELDVAQRERDDLQQALSDARSKQPDPQVHSDADYKYLESKLKVGLWGSAPGPV